MPKRCTVELPVFELLKRQPRVPHVARKVAEAEINNAHGAPIKYQVEQSRNGKSWWISASFRGIRMSNTLHTQKADKAAQWIDAVKRGTVCVKRGS